MLELLLKGILPQDWMPDYKNRNEIMKVGHRRSIIRMLGWYQTYLQNQQNQT